MRVESLRDLIDVYDREIAELGPQQSPGSSTATPAIRPSGHARGRAGPRRDLRGRDRRHRPASTRARHLCSWAGLTPKHRESDTKVAPRRHHQDGMWGGRPYRGPVRCHREVTVTIIGGLDIHRAQLTYDYVDLATGEFHTGRVAPANRDQLPRMVGRGSTVSRRWSSRSRDAQAGDTSSRS